MDWILDVLVVVGLSSIITMLCVYLLELVGLEALADYRWFFTVSLILMIVFRYNDYKHQQDLISQYSQKNTIEGASKIPYQEAEAFMRKRCSQINQEFVKGFTYRINDVELYTFFSLSWESMQGCISTVGAYELQVISADCGDIDSKQWDWNNLAGSPKFR